MEFSQENYSLIQKLKLYVVYILLHYMRYLAEDTIGSRDLNAPTGHNNFC